MLNKSNLRPAFATVGADGSSNRNDFESYAAFAAEQSAEDDFNAFGEAPSKQNPSAQSHKHQTPNHNQAPARKQKPRRKKASVDPKIIIAGVAAAIGLILIIAIFVAVFSSPGKDIKKEDRVYQAYVDPNDQTWHVLSDGKEIKKSFSGEIELVPAKDNSFAYVFESVTAEDGSSVTNMYVIKGNKITAVESEVEKVLTWADYEPGIVYKQDGISQFYSEKYCEFLSSDSAAANFMISGDASTVIYTEPSGRNKEQTIIKYFHSAGFNDVGETAGLIPAAISPDGKYVYAYDESNSLYCIEVSKKGAQFKQHLILSSSAYEFGEITELNATGNEIIFNYVSETRTCSFIYKIGDDKPTQIPDGVFEYAPSSKDVASPATFMGSYFFVTNKATDEDGRTQTVVSTYLYDSKGARKLADSIGQFSADKKYFYYLNTYVNTDSDAKTSELVRIPLNSNDFEKSAETVQQACSGFALTEKGDIYIRVANGKIIFKEVSDSTSRLVTPRSDADSMFACGNSVYFSETVNDTVKIYRSTNGAAKEEVSFKKATATTPIQVVMGSGNKGYAYFTDTDGTAALLYTSDGKNFNVAVKGCSVPGYSEDIGGNGSSAE